MGGPLTASDLQTHQHATECHSTAPLAPPLPARFVLACALEGTVSNSAWVTGSHTVAASGASRAPLSQRFALLFGVAAGAVDTARYAVEDFLMARFREAGAVGSALVTRCGATAQRCVFFYS